MHLSQIQMGYGLLIEGVHTVLTARHTLCLSECLSLRHAVAWQRAPCPQHTAACLEVRQWTPDLVCTAQLSWYIEACSLPASASPHAKKLQFAWTACVRQLR